VPKICRCRGDFLVYSEAVPNISGYVSGYRIYLVLLPYIGGNPRDIPWWQNASIKYYSKTADFLKLKRERNTIMTSFLKYFYRWFLLLLLKAFLRNLYYWNLRKSQRLLIPAHIVGNFLGACMYTVHSPKSPDIFNKGTLIKQFFAVSHTFDFGYNRSCGHLIVLIPTSPYCWVSRHLFIFNI
jgi:hypothetical protein